MQNRRDFILSEGMALFGSSVQQTRERRNGSAREDHTAWVAEVLTRMLSIKPGMTRKALLSVFTTEGGLSTALEQTYVSQDCAYFKVNLCFHAVGRPERDSIGRETSVEDERDVIASISEPYLQFSSLD